MDGITIVGSQCKFDGEGDGFGGVTGEDDDSVGGFGILIGNSEMQVNMWFAIEQRYRAMTSNDLKRMFEVKRRFALLAVEVKGAEFHFTQSAEEVEGGGLDVVLLGNFNERSVDIRVFGEGAHEDAGTGGVDVFEGSGHGVG